jgi:Restriction endonuclease
MSFAAAANGLRHREIARLKSCVIPLIAAMQSLTHGQFRECVAELMQGLGHEILNNPTAAEILVTVKNGEKHLIMCATPADPKPTGLQPLMRLHKAVSAANACRGIYITIRTFTADAYDYVKNAPISLINNGILASAIERVKIRKPIPGAYNAMCYECGGIVQHHLDKQHSLPCSKGHMVAPTIARGEVDPYGSKAANPEPWPEMSSKTQQHPHRLATAGLTVSKSAAE